MFEESKDITSTEKEFLEILGHMDNDNIPLDESTKIRVLGIFVREFKNAYDYYKKRIIETERTHAGVIPNYSPFSGILFQGTDSSLQYISKIINILPYKDKYTPNEYLDRIARGCGNALGSFLAIIEYGITSKEFDIDCSTKILNDAKCLASYLKIINKKVKLKFIRNRLMKIRKKHGVYAQNDKQKELIAKIAGCFA